MVAGVFPVTPSTKTEGPGGDEGRSSEPLLLMN